MIERKMVFISSPYTGDVSMNRDFARKACFYVICQGHTPIAPHLIYPGIIPEEDPGWRQVGIDMGCDFLAFCDEIWLCGPCVTAGMQSEWDLAVDIGLPMRRITCEEIEEGVSKLGDSALKTQMELRGMEQKRKE